MDFLPDFGNVLYTVVAFVVALSVIVTVHEYGHYIIGRLGGIKAEAFSLGFGPTLLKRTDKHGTVWKISAIPLGGYVKFLGDANAASAGVDEAAMAQLSAEERRHTMHGAPLWARAATVAAGPVFNFILSVFIFAGMMLWSGVPTDAPTVGALVALPDGSGGVQPGDRILAVEGTETPDYAALYAVAETAPAGPFLTYLVEREGLQREVQGPQILPALAGSVLPNSAAYNAGVQAGDVVTAIDGAPIWRFGDIVAAVDAGDGAPLALDLWRPEGGQRLAVTLTPKITDVPRRDGTFETDYKIGLIAENGFEAATQPVGVFEAISGGARTTYNVVASSLSGLKHILFGQISSCNLGGAIGIAKGSAAAAKAGLADFVWFIAVLSTAVGFLNLFPIPVLDGGHLMFHLWEGVTGKPPSDAAMNVLMAVGLALVLSLMLFGLWNDLSC